MNIHVGAGIGTGPTTLAAFDSALNDLGIANYNLLRLSSVIPPKTRITVHEDRILRDMPGEWGDRLYVVMAEIRVDKPNEEAWAGVGWVQDPETGRGLFVEHEGHNEHTVRRDITQSLEALMATRNVDFGPIHMKVVGRACIHEPVCAMVAAVYQASDWDNKPHLFEARIKNGD
ncbi:MAG TPA: pyruvoyl-dependent arginine decarboxylase [Candidatus Saccharimonadales bacterium]|nr:pyruvoyl-dependent arginine decarboxylase [Candidatus Saccharimonadales bacterium]